MRALSVVIALAPAALWADTIPLTSDVSAVTLYPQGATITRQVPFSAPSGQHDLILTDLPRNTPLASVRVRVDGAVMGSVTTRHDFVPPRDEDDAALKAAEAEVERLEDALRDATSAIEIIRLEAAAADARVAFLQQLGEGDGVTALDVTALRDLVGMIGEETLSALQLTHDARQRADAAARDLKDLKEELAKARQALKALVPEDEARAMLAVAISADAATDGALTITYNTYDAGWQPVYDLRLMRDAGSLRIDRGAFIHQSTGENWQDVAVTLSTVQPSEQTAPSEIWPWQRRIFDPKQIRQKTALGSMADSSILERAEAEMVVEEAVILTAAAEFDGLAVTYSYPEPVSVASGADRVRLSLGRLETSATLMAQAVPLSDETAFLMASITNDMNELILPSHEAMFYLDDRFVGQQVINLIPDGAEADLSFGPIEGLRLTRTVLDRSEGDRGVLTKSNELTEKVLIEVENLTNEAWDMRLIDRVPYSEQEDLEINWQAQPRPSETDVDGKRGVLSWEFSVPAGQTSEIRLNSDLEWPEGQVLQ